MLSLDEKQNIEAQAYACIPSVLEKTCRVYPLSIEEILMMGQRRYNSLLGLLLLTEIDIVRLIKDKTGEDYPIEKIQPLNYLIQSTVNDDMFLLELQSAFSTFIKEEILILPKINAILIGNAKERRLITEKNFVDFQDILRIQNRRKVAEPPEKESEIARKFRLKREARDAAKKKQQEKNNEGQSLAELFEIAETFGIDYKKKSLYAFYSLIKRYRAKEKWEQDIAMLCAGADAKKLKTKYWGESLEEK